MDIMQVAFGALLFGVIVFLIVKWIGINQYWETRHAIRDELSDLAKQAQEQKERIR